MNTKRYIQELNEATRKNQEASIDRNEHAKAKDVKRMNPLTILERYILKWPPRDVRFDEVYLSDHDFESTDSQFMIDVADGMVIKVLERLPVENSVVFGVYLQSNLAEFERYNLVVDKHNQAWSDQGCPEDVFDPMTGDIAQIKDTVVREAQADSPYYASPEYEPSNGPLTKARPGTKRSLYIKLKYRLDVKDGIFKMGFVARDPSNKVIYYDCIEGDDIAYLSRRSIQELFGNPFIYGNTGALLDGICYLIQGKKLPLCHKHNTIPTWPEMKMAVCKTSNPALDMSNVNKISYRILGISFGYILPVIILWDGILVKTYNSLTKKEPDWMSTVLIACVLMVVSFLVAKYFYRKSNVERLTSKLL
jgi:hypothetical protein